MYFKFNGYMPIITVILSLTSFCFAEKKAESSNISKTLPCLVEEVKGMACIPGGTFIRGSHAQRTCKQGEVKRIPVDSPNHQPIHQIDLPTYYMDLTEVTYQAYQQCVRANKCPKRRPAYSDFSAKRQPMVGLTWYEAFTYCKAVGKHLPTEAEWEKAARGSEGELYPWGNQDPTCKLAVIKDKSGRSCGVKKRFTYHHKGKTLPVMSRPAGRYGLFDMIGNAEEWTADWYTRNWEQCGHECVGSNPKGPCSTQPADKPCKRYRKKVVRGGSWYWPKECATSWTRRPHYPSNKPYHHFGFRCAASRIEAAQLLSSK